MSGNIFEEELATFEREKARLVAEAEGSFALIKGEEVVGIYKEQMDAIEEGYRRYGKEPFLVKQIEEFEIPVCFISSLLAV